MIKSTRFLNFAVSGAMLFAATAASAAQLSVMPLDGGSSIRFGKIDPAFSFDREVKIRIMGFEGRQYQVYQRIDQPLANEHGEYLERNAFLSQGVSGSNGSGSLYFNSYEPVRSGDQLIYTSDMNGTSDTFRMLYSVNLDQINNAGRFNGRIRYYVRSFGSSLQEDSVLDINLEVEDDFRLDVKSVFGSDDIALNTEYPEETDSIQIAFDGFRGNRLRVSHEMIDPPINEKGDRLNPGIIQFYVMNENDGRSRFGEVTDLRFSAETVYEAETLADTVSIYYLLNPNAIADMQSGLYRGTIRIAVETDWGLEVEDLEISVNAAPLFEMEIIYPPGGMGFDRILPNMQRQERAVTVKVKSNLGRPYSVTQNMSTTLQNEKGDAIKSEYFLIRQELLGDDENGEVKNPAFVPVKANSMELFRSDRQGSSAEFQVIYQLKPYPSIKAGNYQAAIQYSLGEQ